MWAACCVYAQAGTLGTLGTSLPAKPAAAQLERLLGTGEALLGQEGVGALAETPVPLTLQSLKIVFGPELRTVRAC